MARRRHYGLATVRVSTSYYDEETDTETDIEVEATVSPEDRECGSGAEVEIVEALDATGKDWREDIEKDARWFDRIYDEAIGAAHEEDPPYDTLEEARGER